MKIMTKALLSALFLSASSTAIAAQVCNENMEQLTPNARFTLSGEEATDKVTGLTWKRCMEGQTWNDGTSSCDGSPVAKNWLETLQSVPEGWRLPNIKELTSIVEYGCGNPSINLNVFPTTTVSSFWSSTVSKSAMHEFLRPANQTVWFLTFQDGTTGSASASSEIRARLVKVDPVIAETPIAQ
ncbi:DUF1566 domain-containing protein [Leucothrix sargassi]|nr:DUF1566 domain-containing protein [Leucothrix sargassi]